MLEDPILPTLVLVWVCALIVLAMMFAGAVVELWRKSETGTNMTQTLRLESNQEPERDGISGTVIMTKEELEVQIKAAMKRVQPNSYALADAALIQLWEKLYGSN
jgi:hypothetical protein